MQQQKAVGKAASVRGGGHMSRRRLFWDAGQGFFCAPVLVCSSIQLEPRRFADVIVRKMNSASASATQLLIRSVASAAGAQG